MTVAQMLSWAPLEQVALQWATVRGQTVAENGSDRTESALAEAIGSSRQRVRAWRESGWVPIKIADRAAVGMRMHPALIWQDEWWALGEVPEPGVRDVDRARMLRRERAEFRKVWAAIDPTVMRERRAAALAESWTLRSVRLAVAS